MKNRMIRVAYQLTLATIIIGLVNWLPMPALNLRPAASAQMSGSQSDAGPLQGEEAIRHLKQQGLYDSLQQAVEATRYEVRWEEQPARGLRQPAYHAPNPAQQFDAHFTPQGLSLAPRKAAPQDAAVAVSDAAAQLAEAPEWQASMRFTGIGYGEALISLGDAELTAKDNRVDYRRAGTDVIEWYVNTAKGLEQGFTVQAAPGGHLAGEKLRLSLELTGDLRADLVADGQAVALKRADGKVVLSYSDLYVYDAKGRELPSRMKAGDGQVWLEVDDMEAVYPVTIDPTFTEQWPLSAMDGETNDYFGYSVAISGDTAVVGSPGAKLSQGLAYVFVRSGTTWSQRPRLIANDGAAGDHFGFSVAISGNTLVVGAPDDDIGASADRGSAYVFVRNGSIWNQQQPKLTASSGAAYDSFGLSVAISGETVVVGAPNDDIGANANQGSACVFVRSNGYWSESYTLTANDGGYNDRFGFSVAISGGTVVVGAWSDDNGSGVDQGSAYVFTGSDSYWRQQQPKLMAYDGAAYDSFGRAVAIRLEGDMIVVGAHGDDNGKGSAYVFVRSGSAWSPQPKLTAIDGAAYDNFGYSVAIYGDTVVVGAFRDTVGANGGQGSAYVFGRSGSTWSQQQRLNASSGVAGDFFGHSVAINGNTAVVGAPYDSIGSTYYRGSACVFIR